MFFYYQTKYLLHEKDIFCWCCLQVLGVVYTFFFFFFFFFVVDHQNISILNQNRVKLEHKKSC